MRINEYLKYAECGRPLKLKHQRLNMDFDQGLGSIAQCELARRKFRAEICRMDYRPHILMVEMKAQSRSTSAVNFADQKCMKEYILGFSEI